MAFQTLTIHSFAQTQIGADIDGIAEDYSGYSVSMADPYTVAIGAPYNDNSGSNAGCARIYSWDGTAWVQKGIDINGEAGHSISMPNATTVAIGAPFNSGNGSSAGHVRIYEWSGTAWVQKGVDIEGETAGDQSGYSVCMPNENTVAIGAPYNSGIGQGAGHVRIFEWNGTVWTQKGVDIDGEATGDKSGFAISMPNANTIAVGAVENNGNGTTEGHVRIYEWDGTVWTQKGVDIDGEAAGDKSGYSVSMPNANTVAIGAIENDGTGTSGNNSGHVRIYEWNGTAWMQKGVDINGEATDDWSGFSVSMPDANIVAIGTPYYDGVGSNAGYVRIYGWNGTEWVQKGVAINGEAANDRSGHSVSMPSSNIIAIGGLGNDGNGNNSGHVRVYDLCAIDVSVSNTDPTLTANAAGATYQWIDCGNGDNPISGETNQLFSPTSNGSYAVIITQDGCTDTSACYSVSTVDVHKISNQALSFVVYPNPSDGKFTLKLVANDIQDFSYTLTDVTGKVILKGTLSKGTTTIDLHEKENGTYLLHTNHQVIRLVKE